MELLDNYGMITADGLRDRVTVGTCTPLKISLIKKKKKKKNSIEIKQQSN